MADTHTVMPKRLAQALMEAGMQHLDLGGFVHSLGNIAAPIAGAYTGGMGLGPARPTGVGGALINQALGLGSGLSGKGLIPGISGTPGVSGFTANPPGIQTQDFQPQIQTNQQNQANVFGQQQTLANQLLNQTQGNGPGQQLIAQQTGQNVANQAALMASQRGANANAGLIGRQAAMQAAPAQQQALNANAALQLQSQGALANQQAQMANQALQGESIEQGGQAAQNSAITQGQLGAQNINANTQMANTQTQGGILGGVLGGAASGLVSGKLFAKGGEVKNMAVGGPVNDDIGIANFQTPGIAIPSLNRPEMQSGGLGSGLSGLVGGGLGKWLTGLSAGAGAGGAIGTGAAGTQVVTGAGIGAANTPGMYLMAGDAHGGQIPFSTALLNGGSVPGQAQVKGDSEKNDTVPTMLSPGEVVIPRSIAQSPNAASKAAEFMAHLKKKKGGYSKVAEARRA